MKRARLSDTALVRDRASYFYVQRARLEQQSRSVRMVTPDGTVTLPVATISVLILGPGTSITHAAMRNLAECGCQVTWSYGDHRRTFASMVHSDRSSRRAVHQAGVVSSEARRLAAARRMYVARFDTVPDRAASLEQIRGHEGVRVREAYRDASRRSGVKWSGRKFGERNRNVQDAVNVALSAAAEALYAVCHAAAVHAGWVPSLGVIHQGTETSFILDIADLYRAQTVIPAAFEAAKQYEDVSEMDEAALRRLSRQQLRDHLRSGAVLKSLVSDVDRVMAFPATEPADDEDSEARLAGLTLWDPGGGVAAGADHSQG